MTNHQPDPDRSRAVLIGISTFNHAHQLHPIPAAANNLTDLEKLLVGTDGVLTADTCAKVLDPAGGAQIGDLVEQAAEQATDTLIIYYTGHGLLDSRGRLYLAFTATDPDRVRWTALPVATIREAIAESRAASRLLILDCCFSGRAMDALTDGPDAILGQADIAGTYTITSSSRNETSYAPAGQRNTAFTAALLTVAEHHRGLTLDDLYLRTRQHLLRHGHPEPRRRADDNAGKLVLFPRRAHHTLDHQSTEPSAPRRYFIAATVTTNSDLPDWDHDKAYEARAELIGLFTERFGYTLVPTIGLNPSAAQLRTELHDVGLGAHPDDLIVFYFAGPSYFDRMTGETMLPTSDTDPADFARAMTTSDLARILLLGTKVRRLLWILDTYTLENGGGKSSPQSLERFTTHWAHEPDSGVAMITSVQPRVSARAQWLPRTLHMATEVLDTAGTTLTLSLEVIASFLMSAPDRDPDHEIGLDVVRLTGQAPPFLPNSHVIEIEQLKRRVIGQRPIPDRGLLTHPEPDARHYRPIVEDGVHRRAAGPVMPKITVTALGASGAGKTSFIAGMYAAMTGGSLGYTIYAPDRNHRVRLVSHWNSLLEGTWPTPTSRQDFISYELIVSRAFESPTAGLNLFDYSGDALVDQYDSADSSALIEHLEHSDGIYIVLDGAVLGHWLADVLAQKPDRLASLRQQLAVAPITGLIITAARKMQVADRPLPSFVVIVTKEDLLMKNAGLQRDPARHLTVNALRELLPIIFSPDIRVLINFTDSSLVMGHEADNRPFWIPFAFTFIEYFRRSVKQEQLLLDAMFESRAKTEAEIRLLSERFGPLGNSLNNRRNKDAIDEIKHIVADAERRKSDFQKILDQASEFNAQLAGFRTFGEQAPVDP
ncbi:caspase, EACC1-associated type [Nocardia takedensis]|uniref:caspase, EACC1-associated type n=1 Tax=Nocardia takedensis TaxID=259390 RepID=UPI0003080C9E|nr:caspase family protein [Nocardia takedensis]